MPKSPEPWERQMAKPIRAMIHDLAFPFRTRQGELLLWEQVITQWSVQGPSCHFSYISCSWCVWEQKMCVLCNQGVTNEVNSREAGCQNDPGAQAPVWTLSPAARGSVQQPALLAECCVENACMSVFPSEKDTRVSFSHCKCPEADNSIFLCLTSPANKMGLLILLPSTHTKLHPGCQWALCSKNQPLTQPACTSWVTWSHPKSQEEPLAIPVGT